jgi:hypothetical protein
MRWTVILTSAAVVVALGSAGCGGSGGVRHDTLETNPGAQAYLDRVARSCGELRIGRRSIDEHFEQTSGDNFLVDATTRLYFGKVDRETYTKDINTFYPSGANRNGPGIACILGQLGR